MFFLQLVCLTCLLFNVGGRFILNFSVVAAELIRHVNLQLTKTVGGGMASNHIYIYMYMYI